MRAAGRRSSPARRGQPPSTLSSMKPGLAYGGAGLLRVRLGNDGPGQRLQQGAVRQSSLSALADSRRQDLLHSPQVRDLPPNILEMFQGQRVDRPAGTRLFGGEGQKAPDFVE